MNRTITLTQLIVIVGALAGTSFAGGSSKAASGRPARSTEDSTLTQPRRVSLDGVLVITTAPGSRAQRLELETRKGRVKLSAGKRFRFLARAAGKQVAVEGTYCRASIRLPRLHVTGFAVIEERRL